MLTGLALNQANAQAIYMDFITRKALKIAEFEGDHAFDPQGRLLIDVTLTDADINEIMADINKSLKKHYPMDKQGLEEALDRVCTPTVTVSLDCALTPKLWQQFLDRLAKNQLNPYFKLLTEMQRGSIIALQQEFHFHLSLATRVYEQLAGPKTPDKPAKFQQAYANTLVYVNNLILHLYAQALNEQLPNSALDVAALNDRLDTIRAQLLPLAHTKLMQEIIQNTGFILEATPKQITEVAKTISATPNDVLHLDKQQGLATLISGSDETSHHRKVGPHSADRQVMVHGITADGHVVANLNPRVQVRVPSLALKEGLKGQDIVDDVQDKLAAIAKRYNFARVAEHQDNKPAAFIYNSYTALNDILGDLNGNLQTESSMQLLLGMHQYNATQQSNDNPVLCLVQNISVNGFGDPLEEDSADEFVSESTLMAELAILHTVYDSLTASLRADVDHLFSIYTDFLKQSERESFFCSSDEGAEAIYLIQNIKEKLQSIGSTELEAVSKSKPIVDDKLTLKEQLELISSSDDESEDPFETMMHDARQALARLMAHNFHYRKEFAPLVQVLSVFAEEANINGCKSGNERTQLVLGRVALLDKHLQQPGSTKLKEALHTLAINQSNITDHADRLVRCIDSEYNTSGLHSAASLISLVDQGATSKIESKPEHPFYVSRNLAENSALTHLNQQHAGQMQAHKGMAKAMHGAWHGNPQTWWGRMKSSPLGVIGALLGVITVIPAVIVAVYNVVDNRKNDQSIQKTNNTLHSLYDLDQETDDDLYLNDDTFNSSPKLMAQAMPPQPDGGDLPEQDIAPISPPSEPTDTDDEGENEVEGESPDNKIK